MNIIKKDEGSTTPKREKINSSDTECLKSSHASFAILVILLLNLIREDSYVTKLLVLKTITISLETLKERYLTQIGDIIPYVSELLEDSNTEVKKCSVELLKYIEKLTGESYQSYLE